MFSAVYCSDRGSQGALQTKLLQYIIINNNFKEMLALKLIQFYIFLCGYIFLLCGLTKHSILFVYLLYI